MATIVIAPGSFIPASSYDKQIASLTAAGIPAQAVDLPSVGPRAEGAATMTDDVDAIVRVVEPLLDAGTQVVLMTHSYGGIPGTQSMQHLSKKSRAAAGKTGGIDTIIYLTSLILSVGMSSTDMMGEDLGGRATLKDNVLHINDPSEQETITFSDLEPAEAKIWAAKLTTHSYLSFSEKLTYPGYSDAKVHYLVAEKDKLVPPESQRSMIELLKANTSYVEVHSMQVDHCPIASKADEVTAVVKSILARPHAKPSL